VVHISTGDALRAEVSAGSELGAKAKECMDNGALVPDNLIIDIVKSRLAQEDCKTKGWLLDGFPRTGAQAEALKAAGIEATHFVMLNVPDDILVERCVGRRSDPETGKIYHLTFNPPPDDPEVQARLVHRSDDTEEAMGKRIKMFHENVEAIIGYYKPISMEFDGTLPKDGIAENVAEFLAKEPPNKARAESKMSKKSGGGAKEKKMHIIIAGAPASGKGTQCELIVEEFGVVHISTGDALRAEVKKGTPLGKLAKECMDNGALVPDDLIIDIVKSRLAEDDCKAQGWLLDGFPRTGTQADELKAAGIEATHFVLLDVPEGILVDRCEGRRSDPKTGKIYHLKFNPPPNDTALLERLVHRSDDTAEAMGKRIKMYQENVGAIIGNYESICRRFDGTKKKEAIFADVAAFLSGGPKPPAPKTKKVMICGAPASGKGTQCEGIVEDFGLVHISTGDELRMHVKQGTELGVQAKKFMDAGDLVPDAVMVSIVKDRLNHQDVVERGWLLDGFPRTAPQIMALREAGINPDRVILLDVPDEILVERCVGRRLDPVTGTIYHMSHNPPPPVIVDRLVQRSDDTAEAMGKRIKMYHANISSIVTHYQSVARRVNGLRPKEEIRDEVKRFVAGELPCDFSGLPPRRALPTPEQAQKYVEQHLMSFIVKGCAELARTKPDKPLEFLATWMLDNNPNKPLVTASVEKHILSKTDVGLERH